MGILFLASPQFPGFSLWCVWPTGDGGNDVSMIQESDCGVGVEGKVSEGVGGLLAAQRSVRGCQVVVLGWEVPCSTSWSFLSLKTHL